MVIAVPGNRTDAIEQPSAIDSTCRHLLQVVSFLQIVCRQLFRLQCSTIAIYSHLTSTCEASLFSHFVCQLIDARLGNTDFHPSSCAEYRMVGISAFYCRSPPDDSLFFGFGCHLQHKAHQFLVMAVTIDQRNKRCHQFSLSTIDSDTLCNVGVCSQRGIRNGLVAQNVCLTHRNILRIGN